MVVPDISRNPAPPKVIVPPVASKSPSASYFPVVVIDKVPLISEVPFAVNTPEDIDKVLEEAIVTVLPDTTSALLPPIASSPSVTVKSPFISNSLNADLAPELLITKLKKLLSDPVVILLPTPLKVTVPAVGVNPPLFPLSSQSPTTSILVLPASNIPAVKVKTPLISKFEVAVLVPVELISKLKK